MNAPRNIGFSATVSARALNVASRNSFSGFDHHDTRVHGRLIERAPILRDEFRRAALAASIAVIIVARVEHWRGLISIGIVSHAERTSPRSENAKVVRVFDKTVDIKGGFSRFDFGEVFEVGKDETTTSHAAAWDIEWLGDHLGIARGFVNISAIYREMKSRRRFGFAAVSEDKNYFQRWIDCIGLFIVKDNTRPLALNKGPYLNDTYKGQDRGKNTNNPSPPEHGIVKLIGWCFLALAAIGGWIGVWSLVFWTQLRRWRWLISVLGWSALVVGIFQGLSLITTF